MDRQITAANPDIYKELGQGDPVFEQMADNNKQRFRQEYNMSPKGGNKQTRAKKDPNSPKRLHDVLEREAGDINTLFEFPIVVMVIWVIDVLLLGLNQKMDEEAGAELDEEVTLHFILEVGSDLSFSSMR